MTHLHMVASLQQNILLHLNSFINHLDIHVNVFYFMTTITSYLFSNSSIHSKMWWSAAKVVISNKIIFHFPGFLVGNFRVKTGMSIFSCLQIKFYLRKQFWHYKAESSLCCQGSHVLGRHRMNSRLPIVTWLAHNSALKENKTYALFNS